MKRTLGSCYYPEHWPEDIWPHDASAMVKMGLSWVRIGEFAWSRLEPKPGQLQLDWLDRAIDVLGSAGLKIILGTPTATPPRWMAEKHPDMFAVSQQGLKRGFGSRRHYCFSHPGYRAESRRITEILAKRYGRNPHIQAWQTDNEYGCHDTVLSYSQAARTGFRDWLAQKYQSIDALNRVWGNVFWSMEYTDFDQIDLPNLTVTEPNPAHVLAFRRYSSDQVVAFNREQVAILRRQSDAPIMHNYMGRITEFDHFDLGADLDIASWDSYPLGFLEDRLEEPDAHKRAFAQQGDPDFQAFHHDLYRAVGHGRWWIMEQQPGPVNWAPYNPAPLEGMCRLWAWEAFAHGAETVCYFRWRQAPFAQEQMHAGLLRPDSKDAPVAAEVAQVAREIDAMPEVSTTAAPVALVFDYPSDWVWHTQPQGAGCNYFRLCFEMYRGLRKLGLDVDIIPATASLDGYKLILVPGLCHLPHDLPSRLSASGAISVLGPRTGSKTEELSISDPLPPNLPGLEATVAYVESLRPDMPRPLQGGGMIRNWMERVETPLTPRFVTEDGTPVLIGDGPLRYLAGWPDEAALARMLDLLGAEAGLDLNPLPDGLRTRNTASHHFAFNYANHSQTYRDQTLPPAGVGWWPR